MWKGIPSMSWVVCRIVLKYIGLLSQSKNSKYSHIMSVAILVQAEASILVVSQVFLVTSKARRYILALCTRLSDHLEHIPAGFLRRDKQCFERDIR